MADMIVASFSVQQQQEIESIVIDKDGDQALRYLSDLEGIFRSREKPRLRAQGGRRPSGSGLRRWGRVSQSSPGAFRPVTYTPSEAETKGERQAPGLGGQPVTVTL